MSPSRIEFSRRAVRLLWPAALLALVPKCFLCVLAYAGLSAALGLSGPEICGASAGSAGWSVVSPAGLGAGFCAFIFFAARWRVRAAPTKKNGLIVDQRRVSHLQ